MAKLYTVEVNFREISDYEKSWLNACGCYDKFVRDFLNTLANMIIEKAIPRTPVKTGRLRRSYKVTRVRTKGSITEVTVYNDARSDGAGESYASYIELGHFTRSRIRWIEGRWMLTISTDEVEAEMQRVWNILFKRWAKRMGIE